MKKLIVAVMALLLATALLATSGLAKAKSLGSVYVDGDSVKVYKEPDTDSKVIAKLKGGQSVLLSGNILTGSKFVSVLVEDTKHGGQREGFVQAKYLSETMPQKYCKHDWGKWQVTKEATCTEKGSRKRTCKICGKVETESIKAAGHDWGKWKVTKQATCAKEGTRERTCKVCGKTEKENYLDEHTYGAWSMIKEPTCTAKGERERTCKVCGHVEKQALDMLPHDYAWQVTLEPTDHSAGTRAKICQVCGKNGGEESFDPEGTLRRGNRGEAVAHMQQLLVEQGYLNAGGADGIFGGGSEKALMKYQQDRNLNPDGIGWPQTLADLEHDFGPWQTVKEMTRTEAGERVRVCRGCGFEQRETVELGTVYVKGDRGEAIRALQQLVKAVGYDAGALDGIYGRKLDAAMAGFAAAEGLVVQEGMIRPADVDALMNAWLATIPAEQWKGEGSADTPVDLALTVTASGDVDDSGIQGYSWTLTNMGGEKANFTALLLSFGDVPDFKQDDLVIALDGYELKPNAANSISGSFSADADWGEGSLNFAALAVNEATGDKWLSNAVAFENATAPAAGPVEKTVAPQNAVVDVNALPDGIYPVAFDRGDVLSGASGIYMNAVRVYTQDWYDIVDVSTLAAGDTIVVEGEPVPVLSVEDTENGILVNEGQDARSFFLVSEEDSNGYFVRGLNDLSAYTEQGVTTLVVDAAATFTDAWDIDSEPATVVGADIVAAMQASENDYFVPYNTTVRVEGGKVVEINRVYVP